MVVMPALPTGERPVDARSGLPCRLLVLVTLSLSVTVSGVVLDAVTPAAIAVAVLVFAVGLGEVLEADRHFRSLPGWVAGLVAVVTLTVLAMFSGVAPPPVLLVLVPIGVGLDFARVTRLRTYVYLSALPMVPALVAQETLALAVTVAWLAGSVASLWFLRLQEDTYLPEPQALEVGAEPEVTATDDLARIVVIGLFVSLLSALALASVSFDFLQRDDVSIEADGASLSGQGSGSGSLSGPGTGGGSGTSSGSGSVSGPGTGSGSGVGPGSSPGADAGPGSGSGSESGSAPGSGTGSGAGPPEGSDSGSSAGLDARLLLAVLFAAGAIMLAVAWMRTRPTDVPQDVATGPWVADLLERIEKEGGDRGAPRRPSETVLAYTRRLASDVFSDDRVQGVGEVISAGLFAVGPARPESGARAADAFDRVLVDLAQREAPVLAAL